MCREEHMQKPTPPAACPLLAADGRARRARQGVRSYDAHPARGRPTLALQTSAPRRTPASTAGAAAPERRTSRQPPRAPPRFRRAAVALLGWAVAGAHAQPPPTPVPNVTALRAALDAAAAGGRGPGQEPQPGSGAGPRRGPGQSPGGVRGSAPLEKINKFDPFASNFTYYNEHI
jgi:hypothetical protein